MDLQKIRIGHSRATTWKKASNYIINSTSCCVYCKGVVVELNHSFKKFEYSTRIWTSDF